MYEIWNRSSRGTSDKGCYLTFTAQTFEHYASNAYKLPDSDIYESIHTLSEMGYVFQVRTNDYHESLECSVYKRAERWQDQQYLQCLCQDVVSGLKLLLYALYEDFFNEIDWRTVPTKLRLRSLNQNAPQSTETAQFDEIPF